jgi:hypothetical protein
MACVNASVSRRRSRLAEVAALGAVALSLLLSSCSQTASDLDRPETVWPEGKPSSTLEDSEWGQVYRRAEFELSLARAHGDFSDPDLIAAIGYDLADRVARGSRNYEPDLSSGNQKVIESYTTYAHTSTLVTIEEGPGADSATGVACGGWDGVPEDAQSLTYTWTFTRSPSDFLTASYRVGSDIKVCGDIELQPGLWKEPFDPANIDPDSVKMPLPREYYIDLGVISE